MYVWLAAESTLDLICLANTKSAQPDSVVPFFYKLQSVPGSILEPPGEKGTLKA